MKRGRPPIFVTGADRQKAYRERKKAQNAYQAGLEALRNSEPPIHYRWIESDLVSPGTCCMYCGLVVRWQKECSLGGRYYANMYEWTMAHPSARHIEVRRAEQSWLRCTAAAVCPACRDGKTREDHDRHIAICLYENNPPSTPVNAFDKADWDRAVAVGVER